MPKPELHLGISAYYHDSAAALVRDGVPIAAAQQERFSRKRHDQSFPTDAVRYCLRTADITLDDLSSVAYYERPDIKFGRVIASFMSTGPYGLGAFTRIAPEWLGWKRKALSCVDKELAGIGAGRAPKAVARLHHRSHAASAFYASPFERAAVLCIDGVGEWHTTTIWRGNGAQLELVNSISYPHSLGLLYSAFTSYCGFKVDSGEYKLMGLAPYGRPIYADTIRDILIRLREDGSFTLNLDYFEFLRGERMIGRRFAKLFGGPPRQPEDPLTQRECDLAASIQKVTDEAVIALAAAAREQTGEKNLCMAGGVALNCVSNGCISQSNLFSGFWIQPAAGDAGCALGAALDAAVEAAGARAHGSDETRDLMSGCHLGPGFDDDEIEQFLQQGRYPYRCLADEQLLTEAAEHLAAGAVVGWFQGRMEFGPRALGARSILADPRDPDMQVKMNLKIKYRESFRPFAPSVLKEAASAYFSIRHDNAYMLIVSQLADSTKLDGPVSCSLGSIAQARSTLPAITHVDMSARVQTVTDEFNGRYARLLRRFQAMTGCAVLVNTSFNVRGEPIVCTPAEAYRCFMRTEMDVLVLGTCILRKAEQTPLIDDADWRSGIPLD